MIEKVSGLSFCDFIEKYISQKIGLKNTGKSISQLSSNLNIVPCFKDSVSLPLEFSSVYGVAGLSSSLNDLCKFAFALYNGKILRTKTQKELFYLKSMFLWNCYKIICALECLGILLIEMYL